MTPENPHPGTEDMVAGLIDAYAVALNDVMRDNGFPVQTETFSGHDSELPDGNLPPT